MTIKDIAQIVGVSPSTVSRVVNSNNVSAAAPETREKIWEAVRTYGYEPNQSARNLKHAPAVIKSNNREIACLFARVADTYLDPFFPTLMHAVEQTLFSMGYNLRYHYSITEVRDSGYRFDSPLDSLVLLGRTDKPTIELLQHNYKNIVYAGLNDLPFDIDQVISSGFKASAASVRYLHSLGHRRICYMGEVDVEERYLGYSSTMEELGLEHGSEYTLSTPFTPGGGYESTCRLLEQGTEFTAIFCSNDMTAIGALKALKEHRKKVPQDVSIIGLNDMETVRYLTPMLTSVHIPIEEMGQMAAKLLVDRIESGRKLPVKSFLPNYIIRRESCSPVKAGG